MICERCKAEVPVVINCAVSLTVGRNISTVSSFGVCAECADKVRTLLEQAVSDVVLNA